MTIMERAYPEVAVLYALAKHGGEAWLSTIEATAAERFGVPEQTTRTAVESLQETPLLEDSTDAKTASRLTDEGKRKLRSDAQTRVAMAEGITVNSQREVAEA